jgi:hypothetical protein
MSLSYPKKLSSDQFLVVQGKGSIYLPKEQHLIARKKIISRWNIEKELDVSKEVYSNTFPCNSHNVAAQQFVPLVLNKETLPVERDNDNHINFSPNGWITSKSIDIRYRNEENKKSTTGTFPILKKSSSSLELKISSCSNTFSGYNRRRCSSVPGIYKRYADRHNTCLDISSDIFARKDVHNKIKRIMERFQDYYPKMIYIMKEKKYLGDLEIWEERYNQLKEKYKAIPVQDKVYIAEIHELQERLKKMNQPEQKKELEKLKYQNNLPITIENLLYALAILLVKNKLKQTDLRYLQSKMLNNIRTKMIRFQISHHSTSKQTVKEILCKLQKYINDRRFILEKMEKYRGAVVGTLTLFVCVQFKIIKSMLPKLTVQEQLYKLENFLNYYRKLANSHPFDENLHST